MNARHYSIALASFCCASSAMAVVLSGPGGRGVPAGSSSLIAALDFSDTFTGADDGGSNPARVYVPAIQPAAAYAVENTHGNPATSFITNGGVAQFSFAADAQGPGNLGLVNGSPAYPGGSGAGSATGFTQTGGGVDYGLNYGLRTRYVVQLDAVASADRIDITSAPLPGNIFQGNSISVFFRGDGSGNASLYNGSVDTPITTAFPQFTTGLPNDGQWHNYAVLFDQTAKTIELFVDEESKIVLDLTTFAGGLYQNFSNAAVGGGSGLGAGQNRTWTDNFQVGSPIPEPASLLLLGASGLLTLRRRRA